VPTPPVAVCALRSWRPTAARACASAASSSPGAVAPALASSHCGRCLRRHLVRRTYERRHPVSRSFCPGQSECQRVCDGRHRCRPPVRRTSASPSAGTAARSSRWGTPYLSRTDMPPTQCERVVGATESAPSERHQPAGANVVQRRRRQRCRVRPDPRTSAARRGRSGRRACLASGAVLLRTVWVPDELEQTRCGPRPSLAPRRW
jgi:hypothetical protein